MPQRSPSNETNGNLHMSQIRPGTLLPSLRLGFDAGAIFGVGPLIPGCYLVQHGNLLAGTTSEEDGEPGLLVDVPLNFARHDYTAPKNRRLRSCWTRSAPVLQYQTSPPSLT